jgi:polyhydroxyalkanoate synthase
VDSRPFKVGENLACTPGAVVYRGEMFELLQYTPTTPRVHERPLLMVPPQLNRHYVLDLAPERSLVEFALSQGVQTFMVVWRNPSQKEGHGRWGIEDYVAAQLTAVDAIREITGSESVNLLGLCAGGTTSALMLGHLAARGDHAVNSATFIVTLVANEAPNLIGMMRTPAADQHLEKAAEKQKVLNASLLERNFALLRPNDLVFNYLVDGWLLGNDPPAFDVLAWNADATNLGARMALETTRVVGDSKAIEPGGITLLGTPIDLQKVDCPTFQISGYTDHITPWRACYASTQAMSGDTELVVVASGHIQSFVNPPKTSRYRYWWGQNPGADPDEWLAQAAQHEGSWWPRWGDWIVAQSGEDRPAPKSLGNKAFPPGDAAPGRYAVG